MPFLLQLRPFPAEGSMLWFSSASDLATRCFGMSLANLEESLLEHNYLASGRRIVNNDLLA